MIQACCLRKPSQSFKSIHRQLDGSSKEGRNFSSIRCISRLSRPRAPTTFPLPSRTPLQCQQWQTLRLCGRAPARFASSNTNPSPVADIQPQFSSPSTTTGFSDKSLLSSSLDSITSSVPTQVYEHTGFLKEMGLDYGWGPTAMIETLLELVHINTGSAWWASIGISLVIIRLATLKFYFMSADVNARNQLIAPYMNPLSARMKAAQWNRDPAGMSKVLAEMRVLRASAGVAYWKMFMPFIQIPIGFGMFRLMRGMSYLPVPGFDTGGALWLQDLTLSDPYLILPVLTGACYFYTFKAGGESGTSAVVSPTARKAFLYVLPPFTAFIMSGWPGALQLSFFIQGVMSLLQATLLRQNWFRDAISIQHVPDPDLTKSKTAYSGTINRAAPANTTPDKGILGGAVDDLKTAFASSYKKAQEWQNSSAPKAGRRTPEELRQAQAYDAKRRRDIAQQRFEREQAKEEKRQMRR